MSQSSAHTTFFFSSYVLPDERILETQSKIGRKFTDMLELIAKGFLSTVKRGLKQVKFVVKKTFSRKYEREKASQKVHSKKRLDNEEVEKNSHFFRMSANSMCPKPRIYLKGSQRSQIKPKHVKET